MLHFWLELVVILILQWAPSFEEHMGAEGLRRVLVFIQKKSKKCSRNVILEIVMGCIHFIRKTTEKTIKKAIS